MNFNNNTNNTSPYNYNSDSNCNTTDGFSQLVDGFYQALPTENDQQTQNFPTVQPTLNFPIIQQQSTQFQQTQWLNSQWSNFCCIDVPSSQELVEDEEAKEAQKLEKKRERNRLAAQLCRKRKLEKLEFLQAKIKRVESENEMLKMMLKLNTVRNRNAEMKKEINDHIEGGCTFSTLYS